MNLPNFISLARLFAVPVVVWLVLGGEFLVAFWLSLAAALSDAIDGIIAKYFRAETVLGAYLDPLADKILLVCLYVTLGHEGQMPVWLVIMVVFRDVLIVGGAMLFQTLTQTLAIAPLLVSKVNTFAQLVLAVSVLGVEGYAVDDRGIIGMMVYIVAATTLASGGTYVMMWTRLAQEMEEAGSTGDREEGA